MEFAEQTLSFRPTIGASDHRITDKTMRITHEAVKHIEECHLLGRTHEVVLC